MRRSRDHARIDKPTLIIESVQRMPPRFYVDCPLDSGLALDLPDGPARHVQVLRLQPGFAITLFNGEGGEWHASVSQIGRKDVSVLIGAHTSVDRELPCSVTLAVGMPANERMDTLIEKATELGVAAIQPLMCERSVLRLSGERAQKKVAHWQAVVLAACEQSGRTRVPRIEPVRSIVEWLRELPMSDDARWMLSLSDLAKPVAEMPLVGASIVCLSGPEGGLTASEEAAARERAFADVSLGNRVLRADTAPVAVLAFLSLTK
jgi:16S rRNA (uracil1498-N3)-methyltransferase